MVSEVALGIDFTIGQKGKEHGDMSIGGLKGPSLNVACFPFSHIPLERTFVTWLPKLQGSLGNTV